MNRYEAKLARCRDGPICEIAGWHSSGHKTGRWQSLVWSTWQGLSGPPMRASHPATPGPTMRGLHSPPTPCGPGKEKGLAISS